ncbi:MAG: hypothetical protein ACI4MB_01545, partial [Candidatus Coproplasma sp.]
MEEKVKVTVEFAGQYFNYDNTAVVVITPNQKLITLNCDGIDLHKLAVLDATIKVDTKRLKNFCIGV